MTLFPLCLKELLFRLVSLTFRKHFNNGAVTVAALLPFTAVCLVAPASHFLIRRLVDPRRYEWRKVEIFSQV